MTKNMLLAKRVFMGYAATKRKAPAKVFTNTNKHAWLSSRNAFSDRKKISDEEKFQKKL